MGLAGYEPLLCCQTAFERRGVEDCAPTGKPKRRRDRRRDSWRPDGDLPGACQGEHKPEAFVHRLTAGRPKKTSKDLTLDCRPKAVAGHPPCSCRLDQPVQKRGPQLHASRRQEVAPWKFADVGQQGRRHPKAHHGHCARTGCHPHKLSLNQAIGR